MKHWRDGGLEVARETAGRLQSLIKAMVTQEEVRVSP